MKHGPIRIFDFNVRKQQERYDDTNANTGVTERFHYLFLVGVTVYFDILLQSSMQLDLVGKIQISFHSLDCF